MTSETPKPEPLYIDTKNHLQQRLDVLLAGGVAVDVLVLFVLFARMFH